MLARGPDNRSDYEATLQTLVGRCIEAVTYYEIVYPDDVPMWNRESESFDSLDLGMTLKLDDGSVFSFIWDWEFTLYNVSIRRGPLEWRGPPRSWDATERWAPLLRAPIAGVTAFWLPNEEDEGAIEYPQDVRLVFDGAAQVTISAFEFRDGAVSTGIDHITVFFDDADVRRFGLGPYSRVESR